MKIGIVGNGFVGSSVAFGFSPQTGCDAEVKIYDKDKSKSTHTISEVVNYSYIIFLSVPTPSNSDGSIKFGLFYLILLSCLTWFVAYILFKKGYKIKS